MKIKPFKKNVLGIKVTIGSRRIREAVTNLVDQINTDKLTKYLCSEGVPDEYAQKAALGVKAWLVKEITEE